jgi:RimJ/RimL family protein N-acetyltransferase
MVFHRGGIQKLGGPYLVYPLSRQTFLPLVELVAEDPPGCSLWTVTDRRPPHAMAGHFQIIYDREKATGRLARVAVAPTRRGERLSYDLISGALEKAFRNDWLDRLELNVYNSNHAAVRVYKKAGFVPEKTAFQIMPHSLEKKQVTGMKFLRAQWRNQE